MSPVQEDLTFMTGLDVGFMNSDFFQRKGLLKFGNCLESIFEKSCATSKWQLIIPDHMSMKTLPVQERYK
jgi:hypothetical protein